MKHLLLLLLLVLSTAGYAQQDSVTIKGRVTDYNGQPIDSVLVEWKNQRFDTVVETLTNKDGYYTARLPKGKYQSMAAVNMATYPHTARPGTSPKDMRLEFWAWNFTADRDTTLNLNYHRMEVYGLNVFRVQGATPAYQIYVRPMSLTRTLVWFQNKTPESLLAPHTEQLKAAVWIDGEEVPILMKQEIKEYFEPGQWGNAYLLTVDMPKKKTANPYRIFKVELTDLENNDRGEGLYYMEKENYVK